MPGGRRSKQTAQGILDAQALYLEASLVDLHDEGSIPAELRKAHQQNEQAVMTANGIKRGDPAYGRESACIVLLMKLYQALMERQKRQQSALKRLSQTEWLEFTHSGGNLPLYGV